MKKIENGTKHTRHTAHTGTHASWKLPSAQWTAEAALALQVLAVRCGVAWDGSWWETRRGEINR